MAKTAIRSRTPGQDKPPKSKKTPDASIRPTPTGEATPTGDARHPHRWTFLSNHAHVLVVLKAQPGVVLRTVAVRVGITERAVQRIIHDLEEEGCIRREKVGRQNRYEVMTSQPLRHPIEAHRKIGDLLRIFED